MQPLRTLHLFAGAGGGVLADLLLGHQPVCAVEIDEYCQQVLSARQEDGCFPWFPIFEDVQAFDGKPWRGIVDVVSGGFPCQDISMAGKGAGITGERSGMWSHMARIIGEVRPRFAFVENSPALLTRGLGVVLGDLAALGYDCRWTVLGAADVGANHQRDRFWLVAHATGEQYEGASHAQQWPTSAELLADATGQQPHGGGARAEQDGCAESAIDGQALADQPCAGCGYPFDHDRLGHYGCPNCEGDEVPDADGERLEELDSARIAAGAGWLGGELAAHGRADWWAIEPDIRRVANGVAARVDRIKAIGNGQVPLCAATAWRMLGGVTA